MTKNRLRILKWWLRGRKNDVGLIDLLKFFFAPSYASKAKAVITKIQQADDYVIIHLRGLQFPLFYPKDIAFDMLAQAVVETFFKNNWHYYQVEETKVEAGDVVVDCGAAEGLFSLTAVSCCKKIYLIEPVSKYVKALTRTFHHMNNAEIIPCALADVPGQAFIQEKGVNSCLSIDTGRAVRVETIDSLFYQKNIRIDFIKADLEGHDFKAIVGARKTIEKYHPKIAITTYHDPKHAKLISDFIIQVAPRYRIKTKGIYQETGAPVMLHAWCP